MRMPIMLFATLMVGACIPAMAQTDAGTPPITRSGPANSPMPQKLLLPTANQTGTISTPRASFQPGETVPIAFVVANPTKTAAVYNFQTGQKFDVTIRDSKGASVWQLSKGKLYPQSLSRISIPPGKKMTFDAVWNGRDNAGKIVPPGDYIINARLTSTSGAAITGGFIVNTDTDPNNMGMSTRTPAETGAMRQVVTMPPVSAMKKITISASATANGSHERK